jgi:hypothetical protein
MLFERPTSFGARFAPNGVMSIRRAPTRIALLAVAAALAVLPSVGAAQSKVGKDSVSRWTWFGRSLVYGTATGLAYAAFDQATDSPKEWGRGWAGYGRRAASNVGAFVIQEGVTEGLAAVMNRPVDYKRCKCQETDKRVEWALKGAITDQMPDGTHPIAVPRIVGAYAGAFAQSTWRPAGPVTSSRAWRAVIQGTTSLALGGAINLWYEFRPRHDHTGTMAGKVDK